MEYARALELARQAGLAMEDEVPQWPAVAWGRLRIHTLRPEQQQALAAWRLSRRGLVVMPTGTGKTEVALAAMAEASLATLVVAPMRDPMYQ
jgi:superfamily II DNA or RNA helicase